MSRGVPTPRVPRTLELRTRGAPRGISRLTILLSIQLKPIRVMYARTGDVGAQFPTTPCSGFLLKTAVKKRGRILYKLEVKKDTDYQIAGVTCKSLASRVDLGGQENVTLLGVTKNSLGHRVSP